MVVVYSKKLMHALVFSKYKKLTNFYYTCMLSQYKNIHVSIYNSLIC